MHKYSYLHYLVWLLQSFIFYTCCLHPSKRRSHFWWKLLGPASLTIGLEEISSGLFIFMLMLMTPLMQIFMLLLMFESLLLLTLMLICHLHNLNVGMLKCGFCCKCWCLCWYASLVKQWRILWGLMITFFQLAIFCCLTDPCILKLLILISCSNESVLPH